MLSAHLCGDSFVISDADRVVLRVPTILLDRHGYERLAGDLQQYDRDDNQAAFQMYLRGFIAAFRVTDPGCIENEPEVMP